jgi:hypothetical protein
MVTMATELFCLNKLLENLRYFHVVFLSADLRVKRFFVLIAFKATPPTFNARSETSASRSTRM